MLDYLQQYPEAHNRMYLDITIFSPVCPTNRNESLQTLISKAKTRKNNDYKERVTKTLGGDFQPIVLSSGGACNRNTKVLINAVANKMSGSSSQDSSVICKEIKTDISMSLIKSRINSIRTNKTRLYR